MRRWQRSWSRARSWWRAGRPGRPPRRRRSAGEYPGVRNILPPGQSGSINAADAAQVTAGDPQGRVAVDGKNAPPNFADQLEMYDALNHADLGGLTDGQLSSFYKDAPLTLSDRTRCGPTGPSPASSIRWDSFGVPYIEGKTPRRTPPSVPGTPGPRTGCSSWTCCGTSARPGRRSSSAPTRPTSRWTRSSCGRRSTRRRRPRRRSTRPPQRFGAEGTRLVAALDAYIAGINAAQQEMCPAVVTGADCPVEYAALQKKPEPWTRADVVYVASLVGGIFGKGGGAEFANARWLHSSQAALRRRRGQADLRRPRAGRRPAGAHDLEHSGSLRQRTGRSGPARRGAARPRRPDRARAPAPTPAPAGRARPGAELAGRPVRPRRTGRSVVHGPFGPIDLGGVPDMMSNAAAGRRQPHRRRPPAGGLRAADRLLHPAAADRAGGASPPASGPAGSPSPAPAWSSNSAAASTTPGRPPAPAATSSTPSSSGCATRRRPGDRRLRGLPGRQRVRRRWTSRCTRRPRLPERGRPGAAADLRVPRPAHRARHRAAAHHGGRPAGRARAPAQHLRPRAGLGARLRAARQPRLRQGRRLASRTRRRPSTTRSTGSTSTTATSPTSPRAGCRSVRRRRRRAPAALGRTPPTTGRAGWPSAATRSRSNPPSGYLVSWNNKQAPGFTAADDQWGYGPVHRSLAISDRLRGARREGRGDDDGRRRRASRTPPRSTPGRSTRCRACST